MNIDPTTAAILAIVTITGILLAVAGYDLSETILNVVGWVGGGAIGGGIGWVGVPRIAAGGGIETPQLFAITAFLTVFGALIGAGFIRLFTQYATGFAGFTAGVAATFFTLVGQKLGTTPSELATASLEKSSIAALELFQVSSLSQDALIQTIVIAAVVGIVTGVLAMRNYDILMSICLSGLGAALLGNTVPMWIQVVQTGPVSFTQQGEFSPPIAVAAFGIGLAVQYIRHRDKD